MKNETQKTNSDCSQGLKGGRMSACTSLISISSIIADYESRESWGFGVCAITLNDGSRLVETALGDGFRIYRQGMGAPVYVAFCN
jgi:hypothetical protein